MKTDAQKLQEAGILDEVSDDDPRFYPYENTILDDPQYEPDLSDTEQRF